MNAMAPDYAAWLMDVARDQVNGKMDQGCLLVQIRPCRERKGGRGGKWAEWEEMGQFEPQKVVGLWYPLNPNPIARHGPCSHDLC